MGRLLQFRRALPASYPEAPLDEPDWREPDELCCFCFESQCECQEPKEDERDRE